MKKLAVILLAATITSVAYSEDFRLDTLDLSFVKQDYGSAHANQSVMGNPITIGGARFAHGVGTHAKSSLVLDLQSAATRFSAMVGVDDEMKGHPGSVEFEVVGDGKSLWKSGVMRVGDSAKKADVDLTGLTLLELNVSDAGDGIDSDHADWADARIVASKPPRKTVSAETVLCPIEVRPGWPDVRFDRSFDNTIMQIGGKRYASGLGAHVSSDLIVNSLGGRYSRFACWVGVDAQTKNEPSAVKFRVFVDNKQAYESPALKKGDAPDRVSVSVAGARELRLVAEYTGDGKPGECVDWAQPELLAAENVSVPEISAPIATVGDEALSVGISTGGEIVRLSVKGKTVKGFSAANHLAGCVPDGAPKVRKTEKGGVEVSRALVDTIQGHHCTVVETITPAGNALRWETTIQGDGGKPWSTSIDTRVHWPATEKSRFWTAWSDPLHQSTEWHDPLVTIPFQDLTFWYGAPFFREDKPLVGYCPVTGDTFCIPMATFIEPATDTGVSVALSPEDLLLDLVLATTARGNATFSRVNYRIGGAKPIHFVMDLTAHEGDWRGGLRWMTERYPRFFNPVNPQVDDLAGCGAYSSYEGALDVEKYKKMAFRLNWKASFDFPYMGTFLPPVTDENERWNRYGGGTTSLKQMREYSRRMREMGFGVLSYFNVTELGDKLKGPKAVTMAANDPNLWKSPNDYLFAKIPDGVLYDANGRTWPTWGGAIAMDPGGPKYQAHLLDQARRHVARLPDACGICIDRLDWLRFYNPRADDGVSWRNGKPARSLFTSWQDIMSKLAPIMHQADPGSSLLPERTPVCRKQSRRHGGSPSARASYQGKVIFVNNHLKRLELLREVDGIYCEFGHTGPAANSIAFLGVRKPVLAWTASENDLRPDPDKFFQKYLYLGEFPTVPFPQNDHTINPTPWAEEQYLRYGPLLDTLRGRKWVLTPRAVEVADSTAKANLFETPKGYLVPIVFGKESAKVAVRGIKNSDAMASCAALYPGAAAWTSIKFTVEGSTLRFDAPLKNGCAVVRISPKGE